MEHIASVSAIEYQLGEFIKIDELDFLKRDPEKLQVYKTAGLVNYSQSDFSILDLCMESIRKTLIASDIEKKEIDFFLYVSENATKDYCISIIDANKLLVELGLTNATPVGISLSDCANVIAGMQMGAALIASNMAKNVLLVCSDKAPKGIDKRKMQSDNSVLSDGAVSCILSSPGKGEFDIRFITIQNTPSQWHAESKAYSLQKFMGIAKVSKIKLREKGVSPLEIRKIFTNNYLRHIAKTFVEMSGFKGEQGFYDNIERYAHTLAGDVLINLKDYADKESIDLGDQFFFMVDSYSSSASMLLVKNSH